MNPLPIAATFSKAPSFWGKDFQPSSLIMGNGARVLGNDQRWYLDWVSALGANVLGYGNDAFLARVSHQLALGAGFTLPHYLEQQVAEKLVNVLGNHVPGWSPEGLGIRFGKTGTDATTMAVRLARAATGCMRVLSYGYHGWGDWSVGATPPHWGVADPYTVDIPFNDLDTLGGYLGLALNPVAAVILEQPITDPEPDYYNAVRRLCDEHGTLLIIDEVVTWPRYGLGGACERYGIEPDIICLGKGLGNGLPISAIVGRREYFDWFSREDPVFVSSTHFGEAVGLAAADAVLELFGENEVNHIWDIGVSLNARLFEAGWDIVGHPPRSILQFKSKAERAYFIAKMRDQGILINRPNLPNLAHTMDDVLATGLAATKARKGMAQVDVEAEMADRLPRVLFEGR